MTLDPNLANLPFERRVDFWTLGVLSSQPSSFLQILRALPGVFPSAVLASLRRLHRAGELATPTLRMLEVQARRDDDFLPVDLTLPPPHPLNYEWRFTATGAQVMLNTATRYCEADSHILMLGTPGVARSALGAPPTQRLTFLGEDNHVTRVLETENTSTGSPITMRRCGHHLSRGLADVVLLDPPWYTDFVERMLRSAAFACKTGGIVLISLAPLGANRSAFEHRSDTLTLAAAYGLRLEAIEDAALAYETPYFEANALRASGLSAPTSWRNADLAIFRKQKDLVGHTDTNSLDSERWAEVMIGRMRVFIRRDADVSPRSPWALEPVVEGEILPSVSRRDKRRLSVDVWTSGNRIFRCSRPDLLIAAATCSMAEFASVGRNAPHAGLLSEIDAVSRLKYSLRKLASKETAEERGVKIGGETWIRGSNLRNSPNTSTGTAGG
tara:strand:- start:7005 stop:8330 length:1326 start_codon:yes stop_codon:yes gene_type:complete